MAGMGANRSKGERKRKEKDEEMRENERGRRERNRRERKRKKKMGSSFETRIYSIFGFSEKVSFFSVLRQTFDFFS